MSRFPARAARYNRQFGRRYLSDLDGAHSPSSPGADYAEVVHSKPGSPAISLTDDGIPRTELSQQGHQKAGPISLRWVDNYNQQGDGVWTVPGVLGVKFSKAMKAGDIAVWTSGGSKAVVKVKKMSEPCDVVAGVVLRNAKSGSFGPIACSGYHWVEMSPNKADGYKAGEGEKNVWAAAAIDGKAKIMDPSQTNGSPFQGPVYRVITERDGWSLIYVNLDITEMHQATGTQAMDSYNNVMYAPWRRMPAIAIYGSDGSFGLSTQLFIVEKQGDSPCGQNDTCGDLTLTHLSLRLGARFYSSAEMNGPLHIKQARVPPGAIRVPIWYDNPVASGECGSWIPAFVPEEKKKKRIGLPEPTEPEPEPKKKKKKKKEPVTTPGDDPGGGEVGGPQGGGLQGGAPTPGSLRSNIHNVLAELLGMDEDAILDGVTSGELAQALADYVNGKIEDYLGKTKEEMAAWMEAVDAALKKLAELQEASKAAKKCDEKPNPDNDGGDESGNGEPAPAPSDNGEGGGGESATAPTGDNPAQTGGSSSDATKTTGTHPGGTSTAKGMGNQVTGCGGNDKDPVVDRDLCTSSVSPDPFPSADSGGGQAVPGAVIPSGSIQIGNEYWFDLDGIPAHTAIADRAGQLWTRIGGMGGGPVLLKFNPDTGTYETDLFQTSYMPVWGQTQHENFLATLASEHWMVTNRHGQITSYGKLSGVNFHSDVPLDNGDSPYAVGMPEAGSILNCDSTSGDITLDLPAVGVVPEGFSICVYKEVAANSVTIDPDGSETINGSGTLVLSAARESVIIASTGSEWKLVSEAGRTSGAAVSHGSLSGLDADDHTQYQLRSEQGAADGYPSLNANTVVPEEVRRIEVDLLTNREVTPANIGTVFVASDQQRAYIWL